MNAISASSSPRDSHCLAFVASGVSASSCASVLILGNSSSNARLAAAARLKNTAVSVLVGSSMVTSTVTPSESFGFFGVSAPGAP